MTDVPLTYRGVHSRHGLVVKAKSVMSAFAGKVLQPHKAAVSNLLAMPLAIAGIGAVDTGVFLASTITGWIVTGISLIVLEYLIADDQ